MEEEEESQKAQCVQKYNNKMMTECREARRHGDKLMRGKGMERYQLKLSSGSGCRHVLFVTRVIADIVSFSSHSHYQRVHITGGGGKWKRSDRGITD